MGESVLLKRCEFVRKSLCMLLILLIVVTLMPFQNINAKMLNTPSGLRTYHSYAMIDAVTGELLMGDKVNEKVYPASTTKLMTAIAIIEHQKDQLSKVNR